MAVGKYTINYVTTSRADGVVLQWTNFDTRKSKHFQYLKTKYFIVTTQLKCIDTAIKTRFHCFGSMKKPVAEAIFIVGKTLLSSTHLICTR